MSRDKSNDSVSWCILGIIIGILVGLFLFAFFDNHPYWKNLGETTVLYQQNNGNENYWLCTPTEVEKNYTFKQVEK